MYNSLFIFIIKNIINDNDTDSESKDKKSFEKVSFIYETTMFELDAIQVKYESTRVKTAG